MAAKRKKSNLYNQKVQNKKVKQDTVNINIEPEESIFERMLIMIFSSILMIIVGMIYFLVTLWIIKFGSSLLGYMPDGNWAVLSASILSVGAIIASGFRH